jgi:methyl-accepting chemotaxis protein
MQRVGSQILPELARASAVLDQSRQISIDAANMRSALRGITLFNLQHNPDNVKAALHAFDAAAGDIREVVQKLESSGAEQDRAAARVIHVSVDEWINRFQEFATLCAAGKVEDAHHLVLRSITPVMDSIQKATSELGKRNRDQAASATLAAQSDARTSGFVLLVCALFVLLAGGIGFAIVNAQTRALRRITSGVAAGSRQVGDSSAEVATAAESLAHLMTEQAASVEETSASLEEITATAKSALHNSEVATQVVARSSRAATETLRVLDTTMASIQRIGASSEKISRIIRVIEEIAFQTNILALNAAVEAARAGEAGMGFAVVAEEVRNLAHRCATAAQDTSQLIGESIESTRAGAASFNRLGEAIQTIGHDAVEVEKLVLDVNNGIREQAVGIEQVTTAMTQIDQVTQRAAAAAEETSSASHELKSQAVRLDDIATELSRLTGAGMAAKV